jgi:hypothetical protein
VRISVQIYDEFVGIISFKFFKLLLLNKMEVRKDFSNKEKLFEIKNSVNKKLEEINKFVSKQIDYILAVDEDMVWYPDCCLNVYYNAHYQLEDFILHSKSLDELILKLGFLYILENYKKDSYYNFVKSILKKWYKKHKKGLEYSNLELFVEYDRSLFEKITKKFFSLYNIIKEKLISQNNENSYVKLRKELNKLIENYYKSQWLNHLIDDIFDFFEILRDYLDGKISDKQYKKHLNFLISKIKFKYINSLNI